MTLPLREALLCPAHGDSRYVTTLVLREGTRCRHLCSFADDQASFSSSKTALQTLERTLNLPVRVLEPELGAVLGLQTLLAKRSGLDFYVLGEPFRALTASG